MPMPSEMVGAEPSPAGRELVEPFLRLESQPDGFQLVLGERHGIVEEDHQPVAGEVFERASVRRDEIAHHPVVRTQHLEVLLRRRSLRQSSSSRAGRGRGR
jgi:hypothetical protein